MNIIIGIIVFIIYYLSINAGKIAEVNWSNGKESYKLIPIAYGIPFGKILSLKALVLDTNPQGIPVMGRIVYAIYAVLAYAPFYIWASLFNGKETFADNSNFQWLMKTTGQWENLFTVASSLTIIIGGCILTFMFGATISLRCARRRFHDIGLDSSKFFPHLILVLSCVPIVNIISIFLLSLLPGKTAHFRAYKRNINSISVLAIPERLYEEYTDSQNITLPHKGLRVKFSPFTVDGIIGRWYYVVFGSIYFYVLYNYLPDVSHLTTGKFSSTELINFMGLWILSMLFGNLISRRFCDLQFNPNERLFFLALNFIPIIGLACHYFYIGLKPGLVWELRKERRHFTCSSYTIESLWIKGKSLNNTLVEYGYLNFMEKPRNVEIIIDAEIIQPKLLLPSPVQRT